MAQKSAVTIDGTRVTLSNLDKLLYPVAKFSKAQVIDYYKEAGFPVIPSFEGLLEASYTAEIMKGFYLQPDFQYFWNPGGNSGDPDDPNIRIPNAAVLGLRTTINY